jgi:hypothetical protein
MLLKLLEGDIDDDDIAPSNHDCVHLPGFRSHAP